MRMAKVDMLGTGETWGFFDSKLFFKVMLQPLLRRLFVTCGVFTRYFSVAFSWLFRDFFVALFWPFSWLFRGFFVAFSWLFRGPRFGQNLRVLALEQSSELLSPPLPTHGGLNHAWLQGMDKRSIGSSFGTLHLRFQKMSCV